MPRDSNGVYSLPAGNPVAAGTLVEADWANTTMQDIEDALNDLATWPILFPDGSEPEPSIAFENEPSTGFYRSGTGDLRATILGQDVFRINDRGVWIWDETEERWIQLLGPSDDALSGPVKYRYWWFSFTGEAIPGDTTTVALSQIRLYKRGAGFINGERWFVGDLISIEEGSGITLTQDGGSTPAGGLFELFDGDNLSNWAGSGISNNTQKTITLMVDFGEGNEQRITGLEFDYESNDALYNVVAWASNSDGLSASDIMGGAYTGTVYMMGVWSTDQSDNAGIAALGDGDSSPHLALVASEESTVEFVDGTPTGFRGSKTLVPDLVLPLGFVTGGGGGALWEFDTTVRTADFTAEAGKYYFVKPPAFALMTLPSSPSVGDIVLARSLDAESVITVNVGSFENIEGAIAGTGWFLSLPAAGASWPSNPQPYAGLIYLGVSEGWVCFMGAIEKAPG